MPQVRLFCYLFLLLLKAEKTQQPVMDRINDGCVLTNSVLHCNRYFCPSQEPNFIHDTQYKCVGVNRLEYSDNKVNLSDLNYTAPYCKSLTELDLSHNNIESLTYAIIEQFTNLKYIDISYNEKLCGWEKTLEKGLFSKNKMLRIVLFQGCDEHIANYYNVTLDQLTIQMKNHLDFQHVLILKHYYNTAVMKADTPLECSNNLLGLWIGLCIVLLVIIALLIWYIMKLRRNTPSRERHGNPQSYSGLLQRSTEAEEQQPMTQSNEEATAIAGTSTQKQ